MIATFEIPEEGLQQFLSEIAARKEGCKDGSVFSIKIILDTEKNEKGDTEVEILEYAPDYTVTTYPV